MSLNGHAILMLLPNTAFREEEYQAARQALEKRGHKVVVASTVKSGAVGSEGNTVDPDVLVGEVRPEDYAGVVLIGGHGASQYWHDLKVHEIVRAHDKSGKIIAAIDRAPVTLSVAGVLKNKKVTGHISIFEKLITTFDYPTRIELYHRWYEMQHRDQPYTWIWSVHSPVLLDTDWRVPEPKLPPPYVDRRLVFKWKD